MLFPGMFFALLLPPLPNQSAPAVVTSCGVRDAQTATFRSNAGYTAVLNMHADDDHGKNTHLCEADYSLQITTPEKARREPFSWESSDGDWNRPIKLRIEGFSRNGRHVFLLISEDKYPGEVEAVNYDMLAGSITSDVSLDSHFTHRLGSSCAATLHIVGTSPTGLMVLGTSSKDGCARQRLWQLSPNKTGPRGGALISEYPKRLSSGSTIQPLDPGSIVQN